MRSRLSVRISIIAYRDLKKMRIFLRKEDYIPNVPFNATPAMNGMPT